MIPDWNSAGVIPPIRPGASGNDQDRSPYKVSIDAFTRHFCISLERAKILKGFLDYRAGLYELDIVSGFQWLDGSFCEHVEVNENRPPNDIDVVSFLTIPQTIDEAVANAHPELFVTDTAKRVYKVDAYFSTLGAPLDEWQTKYISYWYSMWSHRRDGLWKGFFQVELSPTQDSDAISYVNSYMQREEGNA